MLDGAPNFLKLLWCHLYLMCILLHGLVTAIYTPTSLSIFPYIYRCDFPIMLRWTALIQSVNYELLPTKLPMSRTIYLLTNQVICNRIIIYYHHFVEKSYNSLSLSLSLGLNNTYYNGGYMVHHNLWKLLQCRLFLLLTLLYKVVNTVPIPAVPAGMYRTGMYTNIKTSTFRTGLNTGQFWAIPAGTEKRFFFFFKFCNFWIFVRIEC